MPADFPLVRGNLQGEYKNACFDFNTCVASRRALELLKLQADSVKQGKKDGDVKDREEEIFFSYVEETIDKAYARRKKDPKLNAMNLQAAVHDGEISEKEVIDFLNIRGNEFIRMAKLLKGLNSDLDKMSSNSKLAPKVRLEEMNKLLNAHPEISKKRKDLAILGINCLVEAGRLLYSLEQRTKKG